MTAATASIFEERIDPGRISSALLAAVVHVLLFLVLVFGVRWQNRPPESVMVELWTEPVAVQAPAEPMPIPKLEPGFRFRPVHFYEGKRYSALWFARNVLPQAKHHAEIALLEDESPMKISDEAFGHC